MVKQRNLDLTLRSDNTAVTPSTRILLGDSMGELWVWYALASVAFVGGSVANHGGHNPLEAAYFGLPVLMGPHRMNFSAIANQLMQANALFEVDTAECMAQTITKLWVTPMVYKQAHDGALALMQRNEGSVDRQCALLSDFLS